MKTVEQHYSEAERGTVNNRERAVKDMNQVFRNTNIEMFFKRKGFVGETKSGFKWNIAFQIKGVTTTYNYTSNFDTRNVLSLLAKFLMQDKVREQIYSEVDMPCKCPKCQGAGVIPEFYYYCEGICFDCLGLGIVGKLIIGDVQKKSELKGRPYLQKFLGNGTYSDNFPKTAKEDLQIVMYNDHPTAEMILSKDSANFYIHQPVCMSNTWYEIPKSEFSKFTETWNKIYKSNMIVNL